MWAVTKRSEERGGRRAHGTRREGTPLVVYLGQPTTWEPRTILSYTAKTHKEVLCLEERSLRTELEAWLGKCQQKKEVEQPRRERRGGKNVFLLVIMARDRKMETTPKVGCGGQDACPLVFLHCSRPPLFLLGLKTV